MKPNHELLGKRLAAAGAVLPAELRLPLLVTAIYGPRRGDRVNLRDAAGQLVTAPAGLLWESLGAGVLEEV